MEFQTRAQEACYQRALPLMQELFGEFAMLHKEQPYFAIRVGSAFAEVRVLPFGDDQAIIVARAYVVTGADVTPDLMHFLLRKNASILFGAFGLDDDNDIVIDHTVMGLTVDKPELRAAVLGVVQTADAMDDEIIARWGGQRAVDRG